MEESLERKKEFPFHLAVVKGIVCRLHPPPPSLSDNEMGTFLCRTELKRQRFLPMLTEDKTCTYLPVLSKGRLRRMLEDVSTFLVANRNCLLNCEDGSVNKAPGDHR